LILLKLGLKSDGENVIASSSARYGPRTDPAFEGERENHVMTTFVRPILDLNLFDFVFSWLIAEIIKFSNSIERDRNLIMHLSRKLKSRGQGTPIPPAMVDMPVKVEKALTTRPSIVTLVFEGNLLAIVIISGFG
jgi:hypothetical protein